MKINQDGFAEQEHAGESVPAAMHNAMTTAREAAERIAADMFTGGRDGTTVAISLIQKTMVTIYLTHQSDL